MSDVCDRCGVDVLVRYAGSVPVLRHAVPPKADPHYPRVPASRSGSQPSQVPPPGDALGNPSRTPDQLGKAS